MPIRASIIVPTRDRAEYLAVALTSMNERVLYATFSGDGPAVNTLFTELPGVVAQADMPNATAYAQNRQVPQQAQNGQGVPVYATQSSRGTWLFQANPNQGRPTRR